MRLKDITYLNPKYCKHDADTSVAFVPMECLRIDDIEQREISLKEGSEKYTYFANGDLLIAKVTPCFENGNIAVANNLRGGIGFGSSEIFVLRMTKKADSRYMFYRALSSPFQDAACATMCGVGGLKRISPLFMRTYEMDVPAISEQHKIVAYLDKQIDKINKRIWLRERELQTLIKLKQSEIDAVVTRGLNPNVKMKDSGIDWIGQIPEHWEVRRFKEIFKSYTTGITPESKKADNFETDGGYPWITIADINEKKYVRSGALNLSERVIKEFAPPLTKKGSLMFSFKLSIGKVAFAEQDLYTNEAIVSIPPTKKQCFDYFYYVLPTVLLNNATENIYGAKMLNQKIISNMCFALPPKEEQEAIAKYLNEKFDAINKMISNINLQIEKLQLLKKSLINEVITGQRAI